MRSDWIGPKYVHAFLLITALLAAFAFLPACQHTAPADRLTVMVTGGKIHGVEKDGVKSFRGIPFAAPPVGELRWKAPQPVEPWDGVREADAFGPAPMQPAFLATLAGGVEFGEDCLYLNVWTAAKNSKERRPVMVWIYGGAFAGGATSVPIFDGTALAKKGVVLVSVAYRVGPFGYLAHPELSAESGKGSGCYGIQDQIAGLQWVKENIAKFGGDSSCVTIFGESAGGISVSILAASPPAKGLFHRAISQSGGSMAPIKQGAATPGGMIPSLEYAEEQGKKFLADLGASDIRAARALSAETIQNGSLNPCWPVADGQTIVGDPYELYEAGKFSDTPVLVGSNSDDGGLFPLPTSTPDLFEKIVRESFGLAADEILAAYPHATGTEAARSGKDLMRETLFAWPSWAWTKLQSEKGKGKAFLYYFDYGSPEPGGVAHGADVPYVFGNLGVDAFAPTASPENVAMSDMIQSYWVNFAANGDPNGPGLPQWPPFDNKTTNTMILDKSPHAGPTPNLEKVKAFDTFYARMREERGK